MPNRSPNPTFARSLRYGTEAGRRGWQWAKWASRVQRPPSSWDELADVKPAQRTAVVQCSPPVRDMSVQTHRAHLDVVLDKTRSRDRGVQASTNEAADYGELLSLIKGLGGAVVQETPAGAADIAVGPLKQIVEDRLTELLRLLQNVRI